MFSILEVNTVLCKHAYLCNERGSLFPITELIKKKKNAIYLLVKGTKTKSGKDYASPYYWKTVIDAAV